MKIRLFLALAGLFVAMPASATTVLLQPEAPYYETGIARGTYLDTGVYLARFAFDRPVSVGYLTFVYGLSYDFHGLDDREYYGGDDVSIYWDHAFSGKLFTRILKIERPYRHVEHWGGIGDIEELGHYYLEASLGDFHFASAEPVQLDYNFERLGAVPEPSVWAMLIAGFGLLGWRLRRWRARGIA